MPIAFAPFGVWGTGSMRSNYSSRTSLSLLLIAVFGAVFLAFISEIVAAMAVPIDHLNVVVNDINQQILSDSSQVGTLLTRLSTASDIKIALLDAKGKVAFDTGRLPLKKTPYGLLTNRGTDYYTVPVEPSSSQYAKIVIYSGLPGLRIRLNHSLNWSALVLAMLLVFFMLVQVSFTMRFKSFKERLSILFMKEDRQILLNANVHEVNRLLLTKLTEYEQAIQRQAYSHNLEHTKQDERMRNMMHDMKTPIAALHAFVEAYEDGMYVGPRLEQKMSLVARNVNHLLQLTQQYEDFIKYASWQSKINMRKISMEHMVQDVLVGIERDFSMIGRTIQLVVMDYPASVVCDLTEIKKMLHVLVENAHKYSEQDKPIIISAMVRAQMLYLAVKDYGVGIAEEQHSAVFEPFVKLDRARGASAHSYGIGLYIAKQIAIRHGGDVTLESSVGKGALFTVLLPIIEE